MVLGTRPGVASCLEAQKVNSAPVAQSNPSDTRRKPMVGWRLNEKTAPEIQEGVKSSTSATQPSAKPILEEVSEEIRRAGIREAVSILASAARAASSRIVLNHDLFGPSNEGGGRL